MSGNWLKLPRLVSPCPIVPSSALMDKHVNSLTNSNSWRQPVLERMQIPTFHFPALLDLQLIIKKICSCLDNWYILLVECSNMLPAAYMIYAVFVYYKLVTRLTKNVTTKLWNHDFEVLLHTILKAKRVHCEIVWP